jgi:EEF1A lysine methyltransferase 2
VIRISFCRFGADVMDTVAVWTKNLCSIIPGGIPPGNDTIKSEVDEKVLFKYPVLYIGTGNRLLLQALAKLGYYLIYLHIMLK